MPGIRLMILLNITMIWSAFRLEKLLAWELINKNSRWYVVGGKLLATSY
jgi:hypothetical protein